jgi:hypothetical protein
MIFPLTRVPLLPVWRALGWLLLVIVIEVAAAHALQLATQGIAARAETVAQTQAFESASDSCPAFDRYATGMKSIDELHDLKDALCPTPSGPQRPGN